MVPHLVPVLGFLWAQVTSRKPGLCVLGLRLLCTQTVADVLAPLEIPGLCLCVLVVYLNGPGGDWSQFRNHLRIATTILTCICIHIIDTGSLPEGWGKQKVGGLGIEQDVGLMDLGLGYFIVINSLESRPPHSILLLLGCLRLGICLYYPCADHIEYGRLWNAYLTLYCTQWVAYIINKECVTSRRVLLSLMLQMTNLLVARLPNIYEYSGFIACMTGYVPLGILARLLLLETPSQIPLSLVVHILGSVSLLTGLDARLCNPPFTQYIITTCLLCRGLTIGSVHQTRIRSGPIILICNVLTGLYKLVSTILSHIVFEGFYLLALIMALHHWSLGPSSSPQLHAH
ncbi:hypothetical protein GMRT_13864 [Giardia muris]|uniref:Uncharacterized protein n=1 Tax=Giardia muris TaxID=5742 RepID=A0A4Z1SQX7_GIAMU|nr:hypothetical protein GMRT_13864 [Giardia muris]|eukprot:TNJ27355.1 hypothetical protein GMRT_13864 [Giardia muris]